GRRGDDPSRARGGESRARNHAPRRARGGRAPRQGRGRLRPRKARRVGDDLVANTPRPPGAKMRERAFKLARAEASGNRNPPPGERPAVQSCSASRWRGPLDTATTARPTMTETLRMRIDSIAHGGEGIGTLPSGKRVFVPLAAPGDQVEVEIVERRPRYERGRILRVLEPGPERVAPICPHAEDCGGCQLQHLSIEGQLRAKERVFYDALERLGRIGRDAIGAAHPVL